MKTLEQLLSKQSAWLILRDWFAQTRNHYQILASYPENANQTLVSLQLSTHSLLGAIVYETGGIFIDYGWLRILGSGNEKLARGLFDWNFGETFKQSGEQPGYLLIADDAVGGYFAINAGALGDNMGEIYYHHPIAKQWQSLKLTYSEFLGWALSDDLIDFYQDLRWQNWQADIADLQGHQVLDLESKIPVSIERHYQSVFAPENMGYSVV
ncbi:DUF2625 family protein [[Haemophilus] ducreyi]|uniref:DUF2625 family protein n=1 Tax=Haemophilus ducreyi TaxID=730 RepID=UPI0006553590|nr:DUF2625 family protein [[Haemophilus] ducreyi]AKO45396.1 hypothetical protein RZ66_03815 [[Haemophilus] ducreyi]AKO46781.1 hypothetical protein RZ67_03700 [[Haemophilus] ducreyi]ANF61455.1 hypothetical protein A6037_01060 [[Haemophilus] ducreyi]ANF67705.1 hypothetical protein A6041_03615 [[Haemophilus] ducreyi]ANF69728.1 hypothetical protein A6042_07490 [[Haemophilus] ducreyi]